MIAILCPGSPRCRAERKKIDHCVLPMLDAIGTFSLMSTANPVSVLVEMQAVHSAVSPKPASVDGITESPVIDRTDGFLWISRLPR